MIHPSFRLAHASVNSLFCIAKLTAPHPNGRIIARSIITNIDTKNPPAVAEFVCDKYKALFPRARFGNLNRLFEDTTNLSTGKHPDFMANNLKHHDYEHTLQAKVCLMHLLEGRHLAKTAPRFNARQFELAIASALLQDSGYQKNRSDTEGSGAKYTFIHVLRSCSYAASYLPSIAGNESEITGVLHAIRCTSPISEVATIPFQTEVERVAGFALSSADYLAQMTAADYSDEVDFLYHEFKESYDFFNTPTDKRLFLCADALKKATLFFWDRFVLPRLEREYQGVYHFLERPYPGGTNLYVKA